MYTTGLTEQEKEKLIRWLCTQGALINQGDNYTFKLFNDTLDVNASPYNPGSLLKKAALNISNQVCGAKDFE